MWPIYSPFYSRVSGASCLSYLGFASPKYHSLAFHTGRKENLLSSLEHWVKGLGKKALENENKVKQIDMNVLVRFD